MKSLKIIHVLKGKANPNTMNGVNKVVHNLSTTQLAQGHDVQVWGITGTPSVVTHQHNYPLHLFEAMRNRFMTSRKMLAALDEVEPETIFHLHSVFLPELYALSRQLKKRGISWVVSPHGGYAPESLKRNAIVKRVYKAFFEDKLIKDAAAIHAIGWHGEADQFDDTTYKTKVGLVPNGHTPGTRCKSTWSMQGPLRLSYCGRLVAAHKGLDLLISAVRIAVDEGVNVQLDMIGDGPDRSDLEDLVKSLDLAERVVFHGTKMGVEKEELILQADVFVHTSRWEGIPTAVLEAAGMGVPLILTVPTNMAEYISKASAGFVVFELTGKDISRAIALAWREKDAAILPKRGLAALRMVEENFSWENISLQITRQVYAKALR